MKLKIILFNLSIIIFLICLIYLYIYVNYKYEGFEDPIPPVAGSSGEVFRPEGATQNPITDKTTESNVLNESATIAKINPTLSELEKAGVTPETAISARVMPYFNISRAANNKPALNDGYYWVDFNETDLTGALTSYAGATLNPIAGSKDQYLLYNSSGSLILRENYICDILVVGGGGAGGSRSGGGGGAGAVIYRTNVTLNAGIYSITVGAGGAGAAVTSSISPPVGNDGGDTIINLNDRDIYRAKGGGGGANNFINTGKIGGSGGGNNATNAALSAVHNTENIPAGVYGNRGGGGGLSTNGSYLGGGGGGAGSVGGTFSSAGNSAGNGGNGIQINITGINQWYAGCGGGGVGRYNTSTGGVGGSGIGGSGGVLENIAGGNGVPNTGSGGGGGGFGTVGEQFKTGSGASGSGGSGVVIIRFKERASMGKKYTYCLMNKNYFGGGWMLAMRAVRGSRNFGYNSEHWTNATTLNDTIEKIREVSFDADLNVSSIGNAIFNNYEDGNITGINRYDAKFDIFNRYKANEWMAIFYFKNDNGVVLKGGDLISGGNHTAKGWIWRETNLIEADKIERTPLQLFQKRNRMDRHNSLIDLRGNYGVNNVKNLDKFKPVSNMPKLWSSQHGYNFYGINYDVPEWYEGWGNRGSSTRWGFAWNENWDYANNNLTNDVYGGIGLRFPGAGQPGFSAGDYIYCCQDSTGVNRSIAFEWYVR